MSGNSSTPTITRKQAERIFETEMVTRDFWFVTEENDNSAILQDVLNIMYNKDGNCYTVRHSRGQNYTRLCVYCEVCRKELLSFDPFVTHDKGKPHKKALHLIKSVKMSEKIKYDDLVFRDPFAPLGIFPEGSLEDRLDHCSTPVVGLQLVYKENVKGEELYTCQLCTAPRLCKRMTEDETFIHVTSDFHTNKYLAVVYGGYNWNSSQSMLQARVREVVVREGRVNCSFTLLTADSKSGSTRYPPHKDLKNLKDPIKKEVPSPPLSVKSSSSLGHSSKRPKLSLPEPPVASEAVACQTDFESESISHFVEQLRNCVEEETAVKALLQDLRPAHHRIITNVVKVLGKGLVGFFSYNRDDEFEAFARKFSEMTMKL